MVALMLALTLSGWVYANTITTASIAGATVTTAEADLATCNATDNETQPAWEDILIPVADTVILRPNATGDETDISDQYPATGEHWEKVNEEASDGDSSYVFSDMGPWKEDLYNITDHSTLTAAGTITYVKVYMVAKATASATQNSTYIHIKTEGVEHNGSTENMTTGYATYSYQWDANPETSASWTWDEIDALQIGVGLRQPTAGEATRCTQVYAEVGFEAPPLTGNVSIGDLFEVSPHAAYNGDLAVKVYLTNTDNLTKAYQYLNMELYLEGSVEAPGYRLLTLGNGVATFKLEDGGGDNYTLSVNGGDYCLTSREPLEWEGAWTVTPELYCEVSQR